MKLIDLVTELVPILERLVQIPAAVRPYVVVQVTSERWTNRNGPFCQFVADDKHPLILDVPLIDQQFSRDFTLEVPGFHLTEWGFAIDEVTPTRGAELAAAILKNGFDVGLTEEITVTEETTMPGGKA